MTILARILCFAAIVVLAFVIFSKPREITVTEPQVQPQPEKQASKPQPRPRSRPKPQPADTVTFEPENQPIFRSLQSQPAPVQTQRVRKAPTVYEWEETYNAAMMERDRSKRQERIDAAQTAINRRIVELNAGDDSPEERSAIRNAQLGLSLLKESSNNGQSRR
jgi:hypothetical protein